jgi:hypothetical protein
MPQPPPAPDEAIRAALGGLRDLLRRGVVLTADGVKAAMDDAVKRGRMTHRDATELTRTLLAAGRPPADDLLREIDRARRRLGVGPAFPITGYDDLTAAQVRQRLRDLTPPELRKVRDYERRHAKRKSVLEAIERRLR